MNLLTLLERKFYLPEKTTVHGNIMSEIKGLIEGVVIGDINFNADLIIKKGGTVNGNIHAKNVLVKGRVNGNIYCEGRVTVYKNAEVDGNIFATESIIDKESIVKGKLSQLHQGDLPVNAESSQVVEPYTDKGTLRIDKSNQPPDKSVQTRF
jgi:cytoskeletal protein CcmA (bactofilin family)